MRGKFSRCLVAPFVDTPDGIFLTTWQIKIFPGLYADSLSANDIYVRPGDMGDRTYLADLMHADA
jgi:hypothetical protein